MPGTLNNLTVLSASVHLPRIGLWWADVVLDGDTSFVGSATLSYPSWDEDLVGTVVDGGDTKYGRIPLRMSGGAGQLGVELSSKHYQGAPIRLPIKDVIEEAGETLSSTATGGLDLVLSHWVRTHRTAYQCLGLLARNAGFSWRFLPDGSFWFGDETWPDSDVEYELVDEFPEQNAVLIATEELVLPGTMFREQQVDRVDASPQDSRAKVWFIR